MISILAPRRLWRNEVQLVSETGSQLRRDRLLRLAEVESITGLKKSTIYAMMKRGDFPPGSRRTPRCVAWSERAVLQWVNDRIAGVSFQMTTDEASQ